MSQLGRGTYRRLLSAVRGAAGTGGRKRDPRPPSAGEEDETAEEEHAAGEGQTLAYITTHIYFTVTSEDLLVADGKSEGFLTDDGGSDVMLIRLPSDCLSVRAQQCDQGVTQVNCCHS